MLPKIIMILLSPFAYVYEKITGIGVIPSAPSTGSTGFVPRFKGEDPMIHDRHNPHTVAAGPVNVFDPP